jgi:uncharacterized protein
MSNISSSHPQELRTTPATTSMQTNQPARPGWPEILVGLVAAAAVTVATVLVARQLDLGPVVFGLILTALAGIGGIAGFAAAALLRIRSWSAFGVRRTTRRWLLIGVGVGVVGFVLKALAIQVWIQITGDSTSPQGVYGDGGSGGVLSLVLATLFLSLLTPLGEELLLGCHHQRAAALRPAHWHCGQHANLRARPRHQHRLSSGAGDGSHRC